MLAQLVASLSASGLTAWAGSGAVYPIANLLHLLGLVMLVGSIGIVDLRVLGAFQRLPKAELARALTPVAAAGLAVMLPSGFVLFAADAGSLVGSPVLGWKLVAIGLGLINIMVVRWRGGEGVPGRLQAAVSLGLWLTVGTLGRMIAYS